MSNLLRLIRQVGAGLAFTAGVNLAAAPPATGAGCGLEHKFDQADEGEIRPVYGAEGMLAFATGLNVNTDGAAKSYAALHMFPDDGPSLPPRLNTVCNGVQLRNGRGDVVESGKSDESCRRVRAAIRKAHSLGWAPPGPDLRLDWVGVATERDAGKIPCVSGGYYVSKTELKARPKKSDGSDFDACDQAQWIDAMTIPAIVLPKNSGFVAGGAKPGDMAVAFLPATSRHPERYEFAIVGDSGPEKALGEATPALLQTLKNAPPLEVVDIYATRNYAIAQKVLTVVFPRSRFEDEIYDDPTRDRNAARATFVKRFGNGDETRAFERLRACAAAM